jgi:hypothetical protein
MHAFVASPLSATARWTPAAPAAAAAGKPHALAESLVLPDGQAGASGGGALATDADPVASALLASRGGTGDAHITPASHERPSAAHASSPEAAVVRAGIDWLVRVGGPGAVHARSGNGSTPLHWAAGCGALVAVDALLQHGADPHAVSFTWR